MSDDVTPDCVGVNFKHFWHTVAPFSERGKRIGRDSIAQNLLWVDSSLNAKGFGSTLNPHKILETVLCLNFAKKSVFSRNFCSQLSIKIRKRPKSFTIQGRIYLWSFLDYSWGLWAHPYFASGATIKPISSEVKCYDKFVRNHNYGIFFIKHDSSNPI